MNWLFLKYNYLVNPKIPKKKLILLTLVIKGIKMFDFGKRRIWAMNYTRHISLPKDWLRFQNIDAGDEVSIELTESGDLLINPAKEEDSKR